MESPSSVIEVDEPGSVQEVESVTVRFAGDSGDGMQIVGTQFTNTSAILGNDIATFPDFPAEIRAPAGTLAGVSGYQIHFSSMDIHTPGDVVDALVVMNPAALKSNLGDLRPDGILIVNTDAFTQGDLDKAKYQVNPLQDGSLSRYRLLPIAIGKNTKEAVADCGLSSREAERCKNFYSLGIVCWLYERSLAPTIQWLESKFSKKPDILKANVQALKAGFNFGETTELLPVQYRVAKAKLPPGLYRKITGNEALGLGLVTASQLSDTPLVFASYPITPSSSILEYLADLRHFGVKTFQAEDEIAAIGAAIGASYGGAIGVTSTSGPGICLKSEAINLAVMTELPVVIIDVQRGGPSTGLPTKTEQSDLLQAVFGRNGDSPVAVLAPRSPSDCFTLAFEAIRIATSYMCPVLLLSDGYLANGAEPWKLPDLDCLPRIQITHPAPTTAPPPGTTNGHAGNGHAEAAKLGGAGAGVDQDSTFLPYLRDSKLARPWAVPGTLGLEHRIGGLEKQDVTGNISYDPANHEHMTHVRAQKIANIADTIEELEVTGPDQGDLLVIGWGGTYGSITTAVERARRQGLQVAQAHLRYLNPMPRNTGEVLKRYKRILVPELNTGQLLWLLRAKYLVPAEGLNKVQGRPFLVSEILAKIEQLLQA